MYRLTIRELETGVETQEDYPTESEAMTRFFDLSRTAQEQGLRQAVNVTERVRRQQHTLVVFVSYGRRV